MIVSPIYEQKSKSCESLCALTRKLSRPEFLTGAKKAGVSTLMIFITASIFNFPVILQADTIHLKNGQSLEGFVKKETADSVQFDIGAGTVSFSRSEIDRIDKSEEAEAEKLRNQLAKERADEKDRLAKLQTQREEEKRAWERQQMEMERAKGSAVKGKEVRARVRNGHFLVNVLLNGKVRVLLMLDSGATYVTLVKRVADKLQLDLGKAQKSLATMADGRNVEVARLPLESVEILSWDAEHPDDPKPTGIKVASVETFFQSRANDVIVETADKIHVPDDGLLGASFLKHFQVQLDFKNQKIFFQKNPES